MTQAQDDLPSAQRSSVSGSISVSQKQLHTELTQRLQQVLSERNQDPAPQEPSAPQRNMSDVREDSKGRSSAKQPASTALHTPKEAQRNGPAKGKSKREADAAPVAAPAKASTTKALQKKRVSPNVKAETKRALSSKDKV